MKKLRTLLIGIIVIIVVLAIGVYQLNKSTGMSGAHTVNIYNWGDYLDPALIRKFEKQTGYKVNYDTFDSNEAMFTKIKQGGTAYDIAVPSDYMTEKMIKEHLVEKISRGKLVGIKNIGSDYLDQPFDPGNQYSVPYFWGTLGIIYNDKYYQRSDVTQWSSLWQPKFHKQIMFVDGAREYMGIGLSALGYSLNSTNAHHLAEAYEKLKLLAPNIKAIAADEIKMYMADEEGKVAVEYSGDASEMIAENSHLHYVVPAEGTNVWFDNLVIPRSAQNKKGAYAFINFMLEPENAAKNADYIGYSTPNVKAMRMLPRRVREDHAFYPTKKQVQKMEVYEDLGPSELQKYNDLYLELKMKR